MKEHKHRLHDGKVGAALAIRVYPQAALNKIAGIQNDGTLQIHLTAPQVEHKVNDALIEFLAGVLEISVARIQIVAGSTGTDKLVTIDDMAPESLHSKLMARMS